MTNQVTVSNFLCRTCWYVKAAPTHIKPVEKTVEDYKPEP